MWNYFQTIHVQFPYWLGLVTVIGQQCFLGKSRHSQPMETNTFNSFLRLDKLLSSFLFNYSIIEYLESSISLENTQALTDIIIFKDHEQFSNKSN